MTIALDKNNLKLYEEAMSQLRIQLDESKLENEFHIHVHRPSSRIYDDIEGLVTHGPVLLIGPKEQYERVEGLIEATNNLLKKKQYSGGCSGSFNRYGFVCKEVCLCKY